jgi:hypothetical protein
MASGCELAKLRSTELTVGIEDRILFGANA